MTAEPIATDEHDLTPSYGSRALRRWAAGGNGTGQHQIGRCPCLTCADGRAMARRDPLPITVGSRTFPVRPSED